MTKTLKLKTEQSKSWSQDPERPQKVLAHFNMMTYSIGARKGVDVVGNPAEMKSEMSRETDNRT